MNKNLLSVAIVAAFAAAGCTASVAGSVTPGTSPSPGASASPTTGGTTTIGGSTTVNAASFFKVGRKWIYDNTTEVMGTKTTVPFTQEVTAIKDGKATIKTTVTVAGKATDSTADVDTTISANTMAQSSATNGNSTDYNYKEISSSSESVTVKAGTYAATKTVGKLTYTGTNGAASASGDQDVTTWSNADVGLIKSVSTGSQTMSAGQFNLQQIPAGMTIPGMGANGTITFTNTLELVSVTP